MFFKYPYQETEIKPCEMAPGAMGGPATPVYTYPITPRENLHMLYYERKPLWLPISGDAKYTMDPWNFRMGRGGPGGLVDDLGIEWVYEPTAGGSIVHPEKPQLLDDVNNWKEKVHLPDPKTWDWEGAVERSKIDSRYSLEVSYTNGFWFERLISMMGFVPAAMALLDEEQTDAIKEMFQAFTDFACEVITLNVHYFPQIDIINFHDDWGSQQSTFFSEEIARELFLPYMKQLCDHIHSLGRVASIHSCGHNDKRVQVFIDAGIDEWAPQLMNDIEWLYDNYGDKIILHAFPTREDIPQLSEEEQRAEARKFVDRFSEPGKPVLLAGTARARLTEAFKEEVYVYSRKKYYERG